MIKFIEKRLLNKLEAKVSAWWYGLSTKERDTVLDAYFLIQDKKKADERIYELEERNNDLKAENLQLRKKLDPNYQPVKKIGNDRN